MNVQSPDAILARLLSEALDALAQAITVAADKSAVDAIEFIGDWLNGRDAANDESVAAFTRWVARGRP